MKELPMPRAEFDCALCGERTRSPETHSCRRTSPYRHPSPHSATRPGRVTLTVKAKT